MNQYPSREPGNNDEDSYVPPSRSPGRAYPTTTPPTRGGTTSSNSYEASPVNNNTENNTTTPAGNQPASRGTTGTGARWRYLIAGILTYIIPLCGIWAAAEWPDYLVFALGVVVLYNCLRSCRIRDASTVTRRFCIIGAIVSIAIFWLIAGICECVLSVVALIVLAVIYYFIGSWIYGLFLWMQYR